jgi:hypothetical protein
MAVSSLFLTMEARVRSQGSVQTLTHFIVPIKEEEILN